MEFYQRPFPLQTPPKTFSWTLSYHFEVLSVVPTWACKAVYVTLGQPLRGEKCEILQLPFPSFLSLYTSGLVEWWSQGGPNSSSLSMVSPWWRETSGKFKVGTLLILFLCFSAFSLLSLCKFFTRKTTRAFLDAFWPLKAKPTFAICCIPSSFPTPTCILSSLHSKLHFSSTGVLSGVGSKAFVQRACMTLAPGPCLVLGLIPAGPWHQGPQGHLQIHWFTGRIHRTQHIVVITAKIYFDERIQSSISKWKRDVGQSPEETKRKLPRVFSQLLCGVAQDVRNSSGTKLWRRAWSVVYQGSSLKTWCLGGFFGHVGTLFLACTKIPDSHKESRCSA